MPPPGSEKFAKNREKEGKIRKNRGKSGKNGEKEDKSGRKGKNREVSFTLPLLTDRAGYATVQVYVFLCYHYRVVPSIIDRLGTMESNKRAIP